MNVFTETISSQQLEKIRKKDWYRHGVYRDNILFASVYVSYLGEEYFKEEWLSVGLSNVIRLDGEVFITQSEFDDFRDRMLKKIESEKDYLDRYIQAYQTDNDEVLALSEILRNTDFSDSSNEELARAFSHFYKESARLTHWLWSMEFLNPAVERHLKKVLIAKNPGWSEHDVANFISQISYIPHKFAFQREQEDVLSLTPTQSKNGALKEILHEKYGWLYMLTWDGRPWSFEEYDARIQTVLHGKNKLQEEIRARSEKIYEAEKLIEGTRDARTKRLLRNIQRLIYLKTHRIDVYTESWRNALGLIDRICERINLSYNQLLRLTFEEILWCLGGNIMGKIEIERRNHALIARVDGAVSYYYGDAFEKIEKFLKSSQSDVIRRVASQMEQDDISQGTPRIVLAGARADTIRSIRGQIGYKGIARGPAKVLLSDRDLPKLEKGDILVANLTNPNYNQAFAKIAAVVTDGGGILCHSAIMAREFSLPCVIGTKNATQAIKDGDLIEVDANRGVVTKLS